MSTEKPIHPRASGGVDDYFRRGTIDLLAIPTDPVIPPTDPTNPTPTDPWAGSSITVQLPGKSPRRFIPAIEV